MGARCLPCPEGVTWLLFAAIVCSAVAFFYAIWRISMVKPPDKSKGSDKRGNAEEANDAASSAQSAAQAASRVSDAAIFLSICKLQFLLVLSNVASDSRHVDSTSTPPVHIILLPAAIRLA